MVRRGGWRAAAAATCVALVFAACGGDDDDVGSGNASGADEDVGRAESTEDRESDATTERPTPEEEAVQLYRDSNDYMEQALAADRPNPQDPELSNYFSGTALTENSQLLFQLQRDGEYYESTLDENPEVASATSEEVILSDCVTESVTSFAVATGEETGSSSEVYHWRVRVLKGDSGWRVDEIIPQEGSCTP
jgi:hypothetical protein